MPIAAVTLALLVTGGAGGAPTGGTPLAYVALPNAGEVAAVYLGTGRIVARLRVPRGSAELAATQELVLVTSPQAGTVTMIDAASRKIVKVWRGFGRPEGVAVAYPRAYVTDARRGELVVLDLPTRRIQARIHVGGSPTALTAADVILIADERRPLLKLVDATRRRVIGRLLVRGLVSALEKRPDTAEVFVSYRDGSIARLDWGRRQTVFRRAIGTRASDVALDFYSSNRLFATDPANGRIHIVSARTGRSLRSRGGCPGAHSLALVHPWRIVATCVGSSSLIDWDTMSGRLRRTELGGVPAGIAFVLLT